MEKKDLLTKGKAKELYRTTDDSKLIMDFTDDTSAFDGKKIEQLAGKGTVNNRFNNFIMKYLDSKGIACHLLEELSDRESLVLSLDMFPIECVVRNYAAGSICKRLGLEVWDQFDELLPRLSFVGLRDTGKAYESLSFVIPTSVLLSMIYDVWKNKNEFYFTPLMEEKKFERNMYVFSFKHITKTQLSRIVYKIEKTKFGNKLVGLFR